MVQWFNIMAFIAACSQNISRFAIYLTRSKIYLFSNNLNKVIIIIGVFCQVPTKTLKTSLNTILDMVWYALPPFCPFNVLLHTLLSHRQNLQRFWIFA